MKPLHTLIVICLSVAVAAAGCQKRMQRVESPVPPVAESSEKPPEPAPADRLEICDVVVSPSLFNPSRRETVDIRFTVTKPCRLGVQIYGPDLRFVAELRETDSEGGGYVKWVHWDGRDENGNVVPDEAYLITIEAHDYDGGFAFYDPTTVSGREFFAPEVAYDPQAKTVNYKLEKNARLRLRVGLREGPLLNTLLNWAPRLAGAHHDPWDGNIAGAETSAVELNGYRMVAEAFTLPDNSIVTTGNDRYSYRIYRKQNMPDAPMKMERPAFYKENVAEGEDLYHLITTGILPAFSLELPDGSMDLHTGLPIVTGNVPIRIRLLDDVYRHLTEDRYEIICYVDFAFVTEMEEGYSPTLWLWDSMTVPNGPHMLTVNVASYPGHVTAKSLEVLVQN